MPFVNTRRPTGARRASASERDANDAPRITRDVSPNATVIGSSEPRTSSESPSVVESNESRYVPTGTSKSVNAPSESVVARSTTSDVPLVASTTDAPTIGSSPPERLPSPSRSRNTSPKSTPEPVISNSSTSVASLQAQGVVAASTIARVQAVRRGTRLIRRSSGRCAACVHVSTGTGPHRSPDSQ